MGEVWPSVEQVLNDHDGNLIVLHTHGRVDSHCLWSKWECPAHIIIDDIRATVSCSSHLWFVGLIVEIWIGHTKRIWIGLMVGSGA
jgi:hypothetical protein